MRRIVTRPARGRTAYDAFRAICIVLRVSAPQVREPRSVGWSSKPCKRIAREPGHHRPNCPGREPTGSEGEWRVADSSLAVFGHPGEGKGND